MKQKFVSYSYYMSSVDRREGPAHCSCSETSDSAPSLRPSIVTLALGGKLGKFRTGRSSFI